MTVSAVMWTVFLSSPARDNETGTTWWLQVGGRDIQSLCIKSSGELGEVRLHQLAISEWTLI